MRNKKYKPTSFSTTLRNPLRIFDFLYVINDFENKILTDDIAIKIMKRNIAVGNYKPLISTSNIKIKLNENIELTDSEVEYIIENNPQSHKEAGFSYGISSRFQTYYMLIKEFGLIYYDINKAIIISPLGKQVLNGEVSIQEALREIIKKYWSNNIYRKGIANNIQPLKLIMILLKEFKQLSVEQIFVALCLPDMEINSVVREVIESPTKEGIESLWPTNNFNKNAYEKRHESVDDFIRKIFLSGWIEYIPKPVKLIKINEDHLKEINEYINSTHANDIDHLSYLNNLGSKITTEENSNNTLISGLEYWANQLTDDNIKDLLKYSNGESRTNPIEKLKYVDKFIILELAVALYLFKTNPSAKVTANLRFNNDFVPTSAAPGGLPDIEVITKGGKKIAVEVTLLAGTAQHKMESQSTLRHANSIQAHTLLFIAPKLSPDLINNYQFELYRSKRGMKFSPTSLNYFIENFTNPIDIETEKVDEILRDSNNTAEEIKPKI